VVHEASFERNHVSDADIAFPSDKKVALNAAYGMVTASNFSGLAFVDEFFCIGVTSVSEP
jgi:hypothetical protein